MLVVNKMSPRDKLSSPNPLHCPPSLVRNSQTQILTNSQRQGGPVNRTSLVFTDYFQQTQSGKKSPPPIAPAPHAAVTMNHQNTNLMAVNNLQERIISSLAAQLVNHRSMLNYDLSGNNPLLSRLGHQNIPVGPTRGLLSLMNEKQAKSVPQEDVSDGLFEQSTLTRVPCQARGMSTDHNALSAYLEIPNDATHGLHLLCSHPTCRSAGVKFRFCFFCKKPVTKQNFRSRHLHADLSEKSESADLCKRAPTTSKRTSGGNAPSENQMVCLPVASAPQPGASCESSMASLPVQTVEGLLDSKAAIQQLVLLGGNSSVASQDAQSEASSSGRITPVNGNIHKLAWAAVLDERPTDVTLLPAWISKVISLSDPGKVSTGPALSAPDQDQPQRESKWESLLLERPEGNQDNEKMTAWIVKVLETSSSKTFVQHGFLTGSPYTLSPKRSFESLGTFDDQTSPVSKKRKM